MFKFKIIFLSFTFLSTLFFYLNVDARSYNYDYVCKAQYFNDNRCFETYSDKLNTKLTGYYLSDVVENNFTSGGFRSVIHGVINDLSSYYGSKRFTINNFYESNPNFDPSDTIEGDNTEYRLVDKTYRVSNVLSTGGELIIGKKIQSCTGSGANRVCIDKVIPDVVYSNLYEYFLRNFNSIINELHLGLPIAHRKNLIRDHIPIITNGPLRESSTGRYYYELKNVCNSSSTVYPCDSTIKASRYIDSTVPLRFVTGNVMHNNTFTRENFTVSSDYSISSYNLKAGGSVNFNFGFKDYLDVDFTNTTYEYRIFYNYEGDSFPNFNDYFLRETISIDQNGKVTSATLGDDVINEIFNVNILNNKTKEVRVGINEGINLTKSGNVFFYLSTRNINTGDFFPITQINTLPVRVLPNDNISVGSFTANITPFSKELNNLGFNHEDTFAISVNIRDAFGNAHYDNISGYDISLSSGSSPDIELARFGEPNYFSSLTGVRSGTEHPHTINFRMKIPKSGYHEFKGFDIRARVKNTAGTYSNPPLYFTIRNVIPPVLYDGEQLMNIFIKPPTDIDFPIPRCTSKSITFTAVCLSDNFSGCRNDYTTLNVGGNIIRRTITFNSQSQNGSEGTLVAIDHAYNQVGYNYAMNHIDQTAPVISISSGSEALTDSSYNYKANSLPFILNLYELTAPGATCIARTSYEVKVNGTLFRSGIVNGSNNTIQFDGFFQESGTKNVEIIATDNYGNISSRNITFNIFPGDIDQNNSYITNLTTGDKFANNSDYYQYSLFLKDIFGNSIYGKSVNLINQECTGITSGCLTVRTDMSGYIDNNFSNSSLIGNDALLEYGYNSLISNGDGRINFNLRSLSPGEFTNRFRILINEWDNNYNNISNQREYFITSKEIEVKNGFKKLFTGNLSLSKDNGLTWDALPEYGIELLYRLRVLPSYSGLTVPNFSISNFRNFVNPIDSSSSSIKDVGTINGLNTTIATFPVFVNTSMIASTFGDPGIEISNGNGITKAVINYRLGGNNISYPISPTNSPGDWTPISIGNDSSDVFLGVEVIGILQGSGNSGFGGLQEENFSDISKSDIRLNIRRNAFNQIRNMSSGTIVNGVKYIEGDYTVTNSEINPTYQTLVIRNGNLIIDKNININNLTFGIIVLQDNYDINNGYINKGNIYITPNVQNINATLYSDGAIISVNESGTVYSGYSSDRTNSLRNQLVIKGSLFTRNTIGGSLIVGGNYILPGGSRTDNFDLAMQYDLNYIRRGKFNCIEESPGICKYKKGALVIEYDPRIQTNPPKLFSN